MKRLNKVLCTLLVALIALSLIACAPVPPVDNSTIASDTSITNVTPVPTPQNKLIRLSTTTSVNDSGLLPYLQPFFEADTGYILEITSAGTGAAIKKGETGDADCLLVHAKGSEEEFIAAGFGVERIPFMFNYFVIVGPAQDPAGIADLTRASDAFKAISTSGASFISRGDDSGTHKAELKIWAACGLEPKPQSDKWYVSAGAGMGACINIASESQAYVLTDKATYLSHNLHSTLKLLLEKSDEMMNTYSLIAVSPQAWPETNIDGANAFIEWMRSDKAAELINAYGVVEYGEQLFFTMN
ncbi:MAG: substrate-binding domain-containing protein [Clostridia bacterium]